MNLLIVIRKDKEYMYKLLIVKRKNEDYMYKRV